MIEKDDTYKRLKNNQLEWKKKKRLKEEQANEGQTE
jgi:hypothetical protein